MVVPVFIATSSSVSLGWCRVELPAVVSKSAIALHIVYADSVSLSVPSLLSGLSVCLGAH